MKKRKISYTFEIGFIQFLWISLDVKRLLKVKTKLNFQIKGQNKAKYTYLELEIPQISLH